MGVMYISEAEAVKDIPSLLKRASDGEEIFIDVGQTNLRLTRADALSGTSSGPRSIKPRRLSEVVQSLKMRKDADVLLDDNFGDDMEAIIERHEHERLIDPWESF